MDLGLFACKKDEEVKTAKVEIIRVYFKIDGTADVTFITYDIRPNGVEGQRTSLSTHTVMQTYGIDVANNQDFGYTLKKDDPTDDSFVRVTIIVNGKEQVKSTTGNTLSDVYKVPR